MTIQKIYCGDNLLVMRRDLQLRGIQVDLVYLDPPFFTGKVQKGTWKPGAMEISYEDSKIFWGTKGYADAPVWIKDIARRGKSSAAFASYLYYMRRRLAEIKKIMKDTASIYLHCDYRASHYLKMIMDSLFGVNNFRTEIIWQRSLGHHLSTGLDVMTDSLFFYSKTEDFTYNQQYQTLSAAELDKKFNLKEDETGRKFMHRQLEQSQNIGSRGETRIIQGREIGTEQGWRWSQKRIDEKLAENPHIIYWTSNGRPRYKIYADEYKGRKLGSLWTGIPHLASGSKERMGYPTQKPEALLERVIKTSSNPGDSVLDPFCGCGTAIVVAHKLNRNWIGIDISRDACMVMEARFERDFSIEPEIIYRDPKYLNDLSGMEFEAWVNEFFQATKPMPDKGIDGITPRSEPIQTKTHMVDRKIIDQFITAAKYHPQVKQPFSHGYIVSRTGFNASAIARQDEIKEREGIVIELYTPEELLSDV